MELRLTRFSDNGKSSIGLLFINDSFFCYVLEDTFRDQKVMHQTRIPAGEYKIGLMTQGKMNKNFKKKYGDNHHGMLWLRNVPNFTSIYVHPGFSKDHTSGCLLVGDSANNNVLEDGFIGSSRKCYERLYPIVSKEIIDGNSVSIDIKDEVFFYAR